MKIGETEMQEKKEIVQKNSKGIKRSYSQKPK